MVQVVTDVEAVSSVVVPSAVTLKFPSPSLKSVFNESDPVVRSLYVMLRRVPLF